MRRLGGRFEVHDEVATGGTSVVYRGVDVTTGAPAAIKLVTPDDPQGDARALREAAILASLDHPAIVRFLGHGTTGDGQLYIVTEWIDGATLGEVLVSDGITLDDAVLVARRIADALAFAHAAGIAHRDVKPPNILLPNRDPARATLIDFGIARPPLVPSLTETGTVIGTPGYMAPEQVRGDRSVGPATDVFALGCVLYELVTGRPAFPGTSFFAVETKILFGEPLPLGLLRTVHSDLEALVAEMLAKQAGRRPLADEVALALAAVPPSGDLARARRDDSIIERSTVPDPPPAALVVAVPLSGHVTPPPLGDGGRLETLHDGSLLIVFDGARPELLARRAAAAALELRRASRSTCIAVSTGTLAHVDDVARALARELVGAGMSGARAVLIDDQTARLLGDEFAVVSDASGLRLLDKD